MGSLKLLPTRIFYSRSYILVIILVGVISVIDGYLPEFMDEFNDDNYDKSLDDVCQKNENSIEDNHCLKTQTFPKSFMMPRSRARPKSKCLLRKTPYNVTQDNLEKLINDLLGKDNYTEFDLRKFHPYCPSLTEITDQGNCDSCWAVASTDVMTNRLCIRTKGENRTRYSAADLLSCCPYCKLNLKDYTLGACKAIGMHELAWPYWVENGLVSGYYKSQLTGKTLTGCRNYKIDPCKHLQIEEQKERDIEVKSSGPKCFVKSLSCPRPTEKEEPTCNSDDKCEHTALLYKDDKMKGENCYFLNRKFDGKESAIKLEMRLHGPVHATFTVYESFYKMFSQNKYPSEVEPYFGPQGPNDKQCRAHSIRIVGWGKKGEKNYWIVANSWGKKWGNNGFFHLDFNHDKPKQYEKSGKERVFGGIPKLTL